MDQAHDQRALRRSPMPAGAIRLEVVPDLQNDVVRVLRPPADANSSYVYLTGDGSVDVACGRCDRTLMRGLREMLPLNDIHFQCPTCHSHNAIPTQRLPRD